jgi:SusD family.
MRKSSIAAAAICVGLLGCSSFLDADKSVNDPNAPTGATRDQLFTGVLANTFGNQEGPVAMLICQWMQQCAGINGRFVDTQGNYTIDASSFDIPFQNIYNGGGLIGIRDIEKRAADDQLYLGITEVLEAMDVMFAADVWGDIPYSDAVGASTTPTFEPQMQVYADVMALLDKAIADMGAGGTGPGAHDLIYGGNAAKWIEAAHTLKARLYLHQVEKLGNAQYASALGEARKGISTPQNDWLTMHSTATSERNMWAQFQTTSFGLDLVAGSALVDIMKAQNDPRLPEYFGQNSLGGFGGYDVTAGNTPPATISQIVGSGRTNNSAFRQPIITYDETQLIIAEAAFQTNDRTTASTALNTVRARHGKSAIASPTLNDIMTEKYILMFQNPEAWNDYKRTCLPVLKPARGKSRIPGRIFYGATEEQTNPDNTPSSTSQNLFTVRNANDPNSCQ